MMKLLLLPFRVVLYLLRAVFFPWYLRWIFRLPWFVYFALAIGAGYTAYQAYQNYRFEILEAELQIADGPPKAIPLSTWTAADTAPYNDEVTLRGIYFTALESGEFDPIGPNRQFILLADDQGREIKAVLVVWPEDLAQLRRQLTAQGGGDRVPVTINGSLNTNGEWATQIGTALLVMNVPRAQDLVIVEPFIIDRETAIMDRAEITFGRVKVLSWLAGLLTLFGVAKLMMGRSRTAAKSVGRRPRNTRRPQQYAQKPKPAIPVEASPWGTFQPAAPEPAPTSKTAAKPQKKNPPRAMQANAAAPQPYFKSVFIGGGSSFRFKSADQIILGAFGTLSTLTARKHDK